MTNLILELFSNLESKGKLSKQEKELFRSIMFSSTADFFKGAVGSISVVWPAFWAIPTISRLALSTVAGVVVGKWYGGRTIDASVDRSLGLQGTQVQHELASLILRKYKDDKSLQMLVRKHFYSEQVYRDVNSEVPVFLWRPRNTYVEFFTSQNQNEVDNQKNHQHEPTTKKSDTTRSDYSENSRLHEKQNTTVNHDWDLFVDPLESIFGYPEGSMEANPMRQSEATEVLSRRQVRALKRRAHRRQRSSGPRLS